jgi:hypothetical protein
MSDLPGSIISVTLKCAFIAWLVVSAIGVVHSLLQREASDIPYSISKNGVATHEAQDPV